MDPRPLLIDTLPFLSPRMALDGLTPELADRRVDGAPHTIAAIVGHMIFWQEWFAGRCNGAPGPMPQSASAGWVTPGAGTWETLRQRFLDGLERVATLASGTEQQRRIDPPIEFPPLAEITVGEVIVHVATHNAHHLGQIVLLRQMLGAWPPPSGPYTW
jgi:uncharacterized damage-inducible protein DinB